VIEIPETETITSKTEINNNNNDNNHESSQQVVNANNEKDISNSEIIPLSKAKFILVFIGYVIFENYTWSEIFLYNN